MRHKGREVQRIMNVEQGISNFEELKVAVPATAKQ